MYGHNADDTMSQYYNVTMLAQCHNVTDVMCDKCMGTSELAQCYRCDVMCVWALAKMAQWWHNVTMSQCYKSDADECMGTRKDGTMGKPN